ncbi:MULTISPECIES: GNAT family N-acetyltransferase [unclassified Pseudoalteromonas]|uniref:GNAT family N-acetyltransferase n=1 Tax=unclassified Pseudoalteromonas TaxID=194690 RepID=UPI001107C937|nr:MULTISPECIES: GNAT family N-acetyltransferase [unclassified Pseudoalteromonas]TMN82659.1 GNAT family N-acetyltransferase [Pseudoalteromonas sp. S410]TMN92764.1 GNAT family N-acetyltransferase [Pseudoalteromonas sp. S408]TMN97444.1 GNAT family N-acetyltransferase [Pseudoalteromonas sp. S409]TMO01088.1 GNAT family N-acetyltransferase [Pseudoalteromonas sp. S407]TMO11286.1 GNAT family N-acetyltransferase [Pseudoalteromonas sp. S186]
MTQQPHNYSISTDKSKLNFNVIYNFIANSYWAKGIPKSVMQKAIDNSMCFGVYSAHNEQVGFARVVTDNATFAYLADVFIIPHLQGRGLSKLLIKTIVEHPELQGLRRFLLATSDAHGFYAQYGFKPIDNPALLMQINPVNVYDENNSEAN